MPRKSRHKHRPRVRATGAAAQGRAMPRDTGIESPAAPGVDGRDPRSRAGIHASLPRFTELLHASRSLFQNVLLIASALLAAWSFAYLAAGSGVWSLFGYYQPDALMSLVRLVAFLTTALEGLRAAVDADRLPRMSHGWAFVPLLFTFLDILLMMTPGSTARFHLEGGALYLSVLNFSLALVYLVICLKATAEHPEATERFRAAQQRLADAKAERITTPRPSRPFGRRRR